MQEQGGGQLPDDYLLTERPLITVRWPVNAGLASEPIHKRVHSSIPGPE